MVDSSPLVTNDLLSLSITDLTIDRKYKNLWRSYVKYWSDLSQMSFSILLLADKMRRSNKEYYIPTQIMFISLFDQPKT